MAVGGFLGYSLRNHFLSLIRLDDGQNIWISHNWTFRPSSCSVVFFSRLPTTKSKTKQQELFILTTLCWLRQWGHHLEMDRNRSWPQHFLCSCPRAWFCNFFCLFCFFFTQSAHYYKIRQNLIWSLLRWNLRPYAALKGHVKNKAELWQEIPQ